MKKVGIFKSIQFKFVLIYTLLILLAMQLIGVFFSDRMEKSSIESFQSQLSKQADLLTNSIGEAMKDADQGDRNKLISKVQEQLNEVNDPRQTIQVYDNNGILLGTTEPNHANDIAKQTADPYIKQKLLTLTEPKPETYQDPKTHERFMVVTEPIKEGRVNRGLLRIEKSLYPVYANLQQVNRMLALASISALIVTALLGFFLARTLTKPLLKLRQQALAVSQGDFSQRVRHYDNDEIGQLANSFNSMTMRLEEANATTEAERRKLRSVLTYMTDGVIATDRYGHVILMNNRSEELLRIYRQNVLGELITKLLKIDEEYSLEDLFESEESMILDFSSEEEKLLIRANFSIIKKEDGNPNGLIAVLHDVTEQEQIDEERREFVANVSHELRTPLTTMKSYLEALAEGAVEDKELALKFLGVTQNETERMIRLVNDLLQLSKLDAKDTSFNIEVANYVTFIEDIIDRFEMSKTQNIEFIRKLPKRPIYVYIDQDKMTQVVDNIISNAIKYSPEGGAITFKVVSKGHHIITGIKDQGVGIPKDNLSRVFDRFYRVDRARSRKLGGTGLGLAISKDIVQAHGGEIWADSEWNKGTTIYFTLPINKGGK
jgi:two-component system, OmpR family, sensor histidine kinase VicK